MQCDNQSNMVMAKVSKSWFIDVNSIPCECFPLCIMTAAEVAALKKKLKIELFKVRSVIKKIEQVSLSSASGQTTVGKEMEKSEIKKQYKKIDQHSDDLKKFVADWPKVNYAVTVSKKRGPPRRLEGQKAKRQRMDSGAMQQCAHILKKLMTHPSAWPFKQPVDPVKSNIPDYFSIISAPMDLGTIKSYLEKKSYLGTKEFAADVRLTFSNAMVYNAPTNKVHIMAKELKDIFNLRWTSLEAEWSEEGSKVVQGRNSNKKQMATHDRRRGSHKTPASHMMPKRSLLFEEKKKLRKDLLELSKEKMSPDLSGFLQRFGFVCQSNGRIRVVFDKFDDESLWELKSIVRNCFDAKAADVKLAVTANSCRQNSVQKDLLKGMGRGNRHARSSANTKPLRSIGTCRTGSCGRTPCRCHCQKNSTQISSNDISSERLLGEDNHACRDGALSQNHLTNNTSTAQMSKSYPDSDGEKGFFVDQENVCPNSHFVTPATPAASGEGFKDPLYDGLQSPRKALRVAMLKRRFADTILNAQQKTLSDNVCMMQQQRERLEKKQHEEKARLNAQIRASELRLQREREREAPRMAVHKVKRTVYLDENKESFKELEMLAGCSIPDHYHLECIGLFLKDDHMQEEE
ncbi:hypothetical protein HHK36_001630 [Tetracentron sinense]|uniref:Bromo domain-containing protein n=1 Tax=Tetracentron sinense TaxID=13715 RepID=A0A835DRA9_TETSI|nr:hypothetical protein HHK36_001630 [Tetracentron sinense]